MTRPNTFKPIGDVAAEILKRLKGHHPQTKKATEPEAAVANNSTHRKMEKNCE